MNNPLKNNWPSLVIAILLIMALGNHPYSYFDFLRWAVCIVGAYMAYRANILERFSWMWILIIVAVIFNPIAPLYLSRETWEGVDIVTAVIFIVAIPSLKEFQKQIAA